MAWNDELLDRLSAQIPCGYHPQGPASSEPTALAALALSAANRPTAAAMEWLAGLQAADGSIGPTVAQSAPGWSTGWGVLAALAVAGSRNAENPDAGRRVFDIPRAVNWILQTAGDSLAGSEDAQKKALNVGWPWVTGTFSWVEPTAIQLIALKAAGYGNHPRTREAITMLFERLLSIGGCNYGNTVVLGQELRPHAQPTGLAMLALAGQPDADGRIERSLNYLSANLSVETTSASLSYGLMGLAAHDRLPADASKWLQAAYRRTIARDSAAYKLALLSLAALGKECPLVDLPAKPKKSA
jgi:hypothetical protein